MKTQFIGIEDKKERTALRKHAMELMRMQKYAVVRMMAGTVDVKKYGFYLKQIAGGIEFILSRSIFHVEKFIFTGTKIEYSYTRGGETVIFDISDEPWAVWLWEHIHETNLIKHRSLSAN